MKPPGTLATPTVTLHRCDAAFAPGLDAAITASMPELERFMAWANNGHGLAETRGYLDRSIAEWDDEEAFNYVLVAAADGKVIGSAGLMNRMGPGILELGYWVHSAYSGRGIATAAAGALADAGAGMDGIERLAIKHDIANPASGRVAEKLGFLVVREEHRERTAATADSGVDRIWERVVDQRSTSVISNE